MDDGERKHFAGPVFISYKREDWDEFVGPLVELLEAEGFDVWVDQDLIQGGEDWLDEIGKALDACPKMILCVSPEALSSKYVKIEYRYFIGENKPFVPLICRDTELPAELRGIQYLRYSQQDKLIEWLKTETASDAPFAGDLHAEERSFSTRAVAGLVKRYLPERRFRIEFYDLVMGETERVCEVTSASNFPLDVQFSSEELVERMKRYETLTEVLRAIFVTGCYWDEDEHTDTWVKSLERVASLPNTSGQPNEIWTSLRRYPALLLIYSGGLAAVAKGNYGTLASLLTQPHVSDRGSKIPIVQSVYTWRVIDADIMRQHISGMENRYTPFSDHLFSILRQSLQEYLFDNQGYVRVFDRFEYLMGLVHADLYREQMGTVWGPIGSFGWRYRFPGDSEKSILNEVKLEAESAGVDWPPLTAGLFGGSQSRFFEVKKDFDEMVVRRGWW